MRRRETESQSHKSERKGEGIDLGDIADWSRLLNDATSAEEVLRAFLPKAAER